MKMYKTSIKFLYFINFTLIINATQTKIFESGVTEDDIKDILKAHNELRSQIAMGKIKDQPKASNMNELAWDHKLAELAQAWANNCEFKHNRPVEKDYQFVGQNLALTEANYNIGKNFTDAIYAWFNEVYKPGYPPPNFPDYTDAYPFVFSLGTGHFTEVVWGSTSYVGCGYTNYEPKRSKYTHALFYVCNYGPAGNILGMAIYQIGEPASKCPHNGPASKNYPSLCANNSPK